MKYHACAHQSRKWFVSSIDKAGFRDYYPHSVCDMHNYDQLLIVLNALTLLMSRPLNLLTMVAFRPIYCVIFGAMSGDIVEARSFYSRFLSLTANPYLNIFMLSGEFSTELLYEDLNSLWLWKATILECSLHWWLAYVHTHSVERFFFKMLYTNMQRRLKVTYLISFQYWHLWLWYSTWQPSIFLCLLACMPQSHWWDTLWDSYTLASCKDVQLAQSHTLAIPSVSPNHLYIPSCRLLGVICYNLKWVCSKYWL